MVVGGEGERSLEETPTWAVALVFVVLAGASLLIHYTIHLLGKWLKSKRKRALHEALEKIKSELMRLGFISLLLTVLHSPISRICIPASIGDSWLPCTKKQGSEHPELLTDEINDRRRFLVHVNGIVNGGTRRVLAPAGDDKCIVKGEVPLVSLDGIHQLHVFIFILAVFHVLCCITTVALGRAKMKRCKAWDKETKTPEYQFTHGSERFRFARDTTFGRRHLSFWTKTPILLWIVCFFRHLTRPVTKVDYHTLRHGFIMAHLTPSETKFNFHKYIKKSLENDFKVVVGIRDSYSFNWTEGSYSYIWLPIIPLMITMLVGTKLQVIITKMGLRIQDRYEIVKGVPVVEPDDDLFWFNSPRLFLFLINFILFQNAFEFAFFVWTWYTFGLGSCFLEHVEDIIIRLTMGILIQVICSYVTLPLYAIVTQMGSKMKPAIFNERIAMALKRWHHAAKKRIKDQNNIKDSNLVALISSRPGTPPNHSISPMHLLHGQGPYLSEMDIMSRGSINYAR